MELEQKIIIITAPSGSGKTTIVKRILKQNSNLEFSVSVTTRPARANEVEGKDYYFISNEDFKNKILHNEFAEYEMVYTNRYYGTLKKNLQAIWNQNKIPLIDIDVRGAKRLKDNYDAQALSIYIKTPSLEVLRERLIARGTENEESLKQRLDRATMEMEYTKYFDVIIVNDDLETAVLQVEKTIENFLSYPVL